MAESSVRSYDPLAYYVSTLADFTPEIVTAYKKKNNEQIQKYLSKGGKYNYDIYIGVDKSPHAFVMCIPSNVDPNEPPLADDTMDDPFKIPNKSFGWVFELCFDVMAMRTYKIKKEFALFEDVKKRIKRSYYLGRYRQMSAYALELGALSAAPTRYSVLLNDCVEFAKMMCEELLAYCSNYEELKKSVPAKIKKATATGLSIEQLSRRNASSGWFGNSLLGGVDISSFISERNSGVILIILLFFVLVYPVLVALVIMNWYK